MLKAPSCGMKNAVSLFNLLVYDGETIIEEKFKINSILSSNTIGVKPYDLRNKKHSGPSAF